MDDDSERTRTVGPRRAADDAPAAPLPGERIGRFTVQGEIGRGAMGVVYAAHDPELNRSVALKLLQLSRADETARARMLREAQAMARLSHPHVVAIYDVGTHNESLFVAMERVEGSTLKVWLRERARSVAEIVAVFVQAGKGLAAAHATGMIHRDFKPDNVLIARDGRVRVADFGLARAVDVSASEVSGVDARESDVSAAPSFDALSSRSDLLNSSLTVEGSLVGTLAYMAPEQLRNEPLDARADEFSFAVALFEALYGERPYRREDANLQRRPQPKGRVPGWLRRVVERGIALSPAARYPSMEALVRALEADPTPRRWRLLAVGVGGLLTLGAVFIGARLLRHPSACDVLDQAFEATWNDKVRSAIEAGFVASGAADARERWPFANKALDREADQWRTSEHHVCAALASRGQPDSAVYVRLECLDRQRAAFGVLLETLAHPAPALVMASVEAIQALDSPAECDDAAIPPILDDLPKDKADKAKAIRADQVRAVAKEATGDRKEALDLTSGLLKDAEALGDVPLQVSLLIDLAKMYATQGKHQESVLQAREALRLADLARMDLAGAKASARIAVELAFTGASRAEVDVAVDEMAKAVARAHNSVLARLPSEFTRGCILNLRGDEQEAIPHFEEFIRLERERGGPDTIQVIIALNNIGAAEDNLGRYADAVATYREAIGLSERVKGVIRGNLRLINLNLGWDLLGVGQLVEGREALAHTLVPPENVFSAEAHALLSVAAETEGDRAEALTQIEQALALLETLNVGDNVEAYEVLDRAAFILAKAGQTDRAKALATRALDNATRQLDPQTADWVPVLGFLGATAEIVEDPKLAVSLLERALLLARHPFYPGVMASIRYRLARALVETHGDPNRAQELARTAEKELKDAPWQHRLREEIVAWRRQAFGL